MTAQVDIAAIKARAAKHRELKIESKKKPGWTFFLRRPTDLNVREAIADGQTRNQVRFQTEQVYAALIGWEGPTVGDVDPGATKEQKALALPFDPELFELLFGDRSDLLDELGAKLMESFAERRKKREEASKN